MNAPIGQLALARYTLDDRYRERRVFLTGTQALVRLLINQKIRDQAAGLNTAGFVSGYRGSPLGGLDKELWRAQAFLRDHAIVFQPGVNEDLAATAVWGTQQVGLFPGARYDGVFALWYGKGPGVDRSGDVLRHGNAAGTSPHGGVLVVAGDDHAAKSSTLPHQTDHIFKAVMMPVLAPANVQEYLDYGIHGYALSRYSGCWVAFKAVADTVESAASVDADPFRVTVTLPTDFPMPPGGLNIRWPDPPRVQEERLLHHKLYAALAYARANELNRIVIEPERPRLGIITSGKSYLDVLQALEDLGIDAERAKAIGIRLMKVGMVWPLEADAVRRFADGLEEILVVEEKRQLIEYQLKEELYNWREDVRPRVVGKFDEKGEWAHLVRPDGTVDHGEWLLPAAGELTPAMIARAIGNRLARWYDSPEMRARLEWIAQKEAALARLPLHAERLPTFCPGCPHNTSTRVPEGSRAVAGIGCHYMVTWMPERHTSTFTQMGGEGVPWVGQAPFTETRHIFANLGDGTYYHSGILAIRQCIAAGVNITFKILYNDAVAMTGGQPVDGPLTVPMIVAQLKAEGVHNLVIVTDGTPHVYGPADVDHVPIRHRKELDAIQREFRALPGVSAIIYDQTCAAEKRRRRKRKQFPDPPRRLFIHPEVCEGCGDCGEVSNCVAVWPLETEFGRKRQIDQSSCNKDYSCADGFCPSFLVLENAQLKKGEALAGDDDWPLPPEPGVPALDRPWNLLVTGVGGTGVVTIGALIGMAAHLEGKGVTTLDMTGLAQKGGAVFSHIRLAATPERITAARIAAGEADAVIGGDLIVTASDEALAKMAVGRTRVVVNTAETPTLEFTRNPDWQFPRERLLAQIGEAIGGAPFAFDATQLATRLMGDALFTNAFLLGYAWQQGWVPVSEAALLRAIELNGVAVAANQKAFLWGRRAAVDLDAVRAFAHSEPKGILRLSQTLDEMIARRVAHLTRYQNARYAERYRERVERIRVAERALRHQAGQALPDSASETPDDLPLTATVAREYHRLLAIKDEYEVARLWSSPEVWQQLGETFEPGFTPKFLLAPPFLAKPDPLTGRIEKRTYGPWLRRVFPWLARLKFLRGTPFDPFGQSAERRWERKLIRLYESDLAEIADQLRRDRATLDAVSRAEALARWPRTVRGFGHVKRRHGEAALAARERAREALRNGNTAT